MSDAATLERPPAENVFATLSTIAAPDEKALNAGPTAMLRMAQTFTINSDDEYRLAADELKAVKAKSKALEEKRVAITGPLNKAMKAVNDLFRGPLLALEQAESMFKDGMLGYTAAQEKIAADARRKAEEATAAERERLAAEARAREEAAAAEQRRIAAAEAARAAEARAEQVRLDKIAADAKAAGDAAAAREAEAVAAKQRADDAVAAERAAAETARVQQAAALEVAAIESVAAVIVAPQAAAPAVKVAGVSSATSYDYEVISMLELVKHVAEHPEHIGLLMVDSTKLRGLVRSLGANTKIAGVRVFPKKTLRSAA